MGKLIVFPHISSLMLSEVGSLMSSIMQWQHALAMSLIRPRPRKSLLLQGQEQRQEHTNMPTQAKD